MLQHSTPERRLLLDTWIAAACVSEALRRLKEAHDHVPPAPTAAWLEEYHEAWAYYDRAHDSFASKDAALREWHVRVSRSHTGGTR